MSEKLEKTKFILERAYISSEIPFHVYNNSGECVLFVGENDDVITPFLTGVDLLEKVKGNEQNTEPSMYVENDVFVYGVFCDEFGYLYVCGPVIVEDVDKYKLFEYKERHEIIGDAFEIKYSTYKSIANILSIAYFGVTNKCYTEEMILSSLKNTKNHTTVDNMDIEQNNSENSESEAGRLSYIYEHNYLSAIEEGNVEFFLDTHIVEPNDKEKIDRLVNDNNKQNEYTCLTSIALVTRASIRGGLYPSKAYALSDMYMKKLEKCKNSYEIMELHQTMRNDFATRVREGKSNRKNKDYIQKCKDYIEQQLCYPISIKDIANTIGINHSYLSRKFVEQEGMTIAQYCIKARLRASSSMLKYSQFSISEVANYFCFASQSRFAEQFKKEYGVTPKVYRKQNQVVSFIEKE